MGTPTRDAHSSANPGRPAGAAATSAPAAGSINPRLGYTLAVLNMVISGVAIYVNGLGVTTFPHTFAGSTVYTTLKNAVVGVALLIPLLFLRQKRAEYRRLTGPQLGLLVVVAIIGGSAAYALDFRGLQLAGPVTASLIDHTQFLFVALLAALLLSERVGAGVWAALPVLFVGLVLALGLQTVTAKNANTGALLVLAATLLFALDFVLIKYLLRSVSVLMAMTFKMTLGAALLFAFVALTGGLRIIAHLTLTQWSFVLVTGLILLAFTVTSIMGLRHASATAVTAIPAASPIITTLLVVISRHTHVSSTVWLGLALLLVSVLAIFILGQRRELRLARTTGREAIA